MFWHQVLQKKLTLLCKCLFMCLKLLFVFIATIACCLYFDLFLCFVNHSHIFYALLLNNFFFPVCIKQHLCTWLGISFDSKNFYNKYYSWHVLYPTHCLYMRIYGTQIKYQYHISIYIFNVKGAISYLKVFGSCMRLCTCTMAWWWPILVVETSCQVINIPRRLGCVWLKTSLLYMYITRTRAN
jgi:hypothetical protein